MSTLTLKSHRERERCEIFRKEELIDGFSSQKKFWFDVTSNLDVRILILSNEIEYHF